MHTGVQSPVFDSPFPLRRLGDVRAGQQALRQRPRVRLIDPLGPAILLLLLQQRERRFEVGGMDSILGIQVVHQWHQFGMAEAIVPEELPHRRPVLLRAVGVVVLAIGPAARPGPLRRPPDSMSGQRPVEKLPAVVGGKSFPAWGTTGSSAHAGTSAASALLFQTARFSVPPRERPVNARELTWSPSVASPQCATVSAATEPGRGVSGGPERVGPAGRRCARGRVAVRPFSDAARAPDAGGGRSARD